MQENYLKKPMRRGLPESHDISEEDARFMQMAIDLSIENVRNGGGPFGAVIVRDGKVLATGVNRVTANCDPTAHAEVSAIRAACAATGEFHLKGATVYSSCEPCPMCLSAIYWANLSRLCYGNTKEDAKAASSSTSSWSCPTRSAASAASTSWATRPSRLSASGPTSPTKSPIER